MQSRRTLRIIDRNACVLSVAVLTHSVARPWQDGRGSSEVWKQRLLTMLRPVSFVEWPAFVQ